MKAARAAVLAIVAGVLSTPAVAQRDPWVEGVRDSERALERLHQDERQRDYERRQDYEQQRRDSEAREQRANDRAEQMREVNRIRQQPEGQELGMSRRRR